MTPPNTPGSLDAITAPWLASALGLPVERIAVQPLVGPEAGFLGDVARVIVGYRDRDPGSQSGEWPASVIVWQLASARIALILANFSSIRSPPKASRSL